ncbi:MAG: translation initiation factor IF-2 [Myxococcales bacterium 68-20]|nr:MAG: translation initiation factor IF-2 [Myxococcales bacterium 68-20]
MSKVRVYEVAKQLNLDPKQVVTLFQSIGVTDVRNHMSSVEAEAVERLKRNLEKQKTHDVVEERIRRGAGTVLKRRAVAKAPAESTPASVQPVSAAQPSSPVLDDVASRRDISQLAIEAPPSQTAVAKAASATDVLAKDESTRILAYREVPEDRRSASEVAVPSAPPAPPSARPSSRTDVAAVPPAPESRTSEPAIAAPPSQTSLTPVTPQVPTPPPSAHAVAPAAQPEVPPAPASVPVQEVVPVAAASAPAPVAEAPASVAPAPQAPVPVSEAPRAPTPAPEVAAAAPRPQTQAPPSPPPRVASPPKTGVEYWAGRPGVPMPTPIGAQRTGIGGGAAGLNARRVQFDPRAGAGQQRGGMRPGQQGRPGMMGRGGPGGRFGRPGMMNVRKGPVNVSTKEMSAHKKVIRIEESITLSAMAAQMSLKATELLMRLLSMGKTGIHINTTLDADDAAILASEFGWEVENVATTEEEDIAEARGEETTTGEVDPDLQPRPPVVTVMGHVDHGKTSLLDRIRKANVASGEAGGITQHIGAYKVQTQSGTIVFLDTPGHEAFTAMRARGASATDIVVLVVAADDGVMPQTKEAIAHAKAAKVPIIVAVNKIDKPSADPERVKRELVEQGLQPEEWGGDTIFTNVSALTGDGIPGLLEMLALQAEVLDLKANPKKPASGVVLEALLDRGRGPVARILVQEGTLKVGDFVLAGPGFGKVRAMTNEHGKQVHEAGPATPVEILGLSDVPSAGDPLHAVKDPKKALEIAESRKAKQDKSKQGTDKGISLQGLMERLQAGDQQELRVIVKADVHGSSEALNSAFNKLSTEKVKLSIVHSGVGAITEGDVNLAIAAKAILIGFNVRPAGKAAAHAEENKIEIRTYSIIYDAVDDVKRAMEGLLPTTKVEKLSGKAEVRAIFKIRGIIVAGCYVIQGKIGRNNHARLMRDGAMVWEGKLDALKRFKDDVKDVAEGFECGISLDGYSDLKDKDIIESFEIEEIKQKL